MSWANAAIGDVVRIERSGVSPEKIESGTTYVGLEHIDGSGGFVDVVSVEAGELASSKFQFTKGHVLFGKLRPYLRKTARPNFEGVCSTDILPLEPTSRVDRDYLFHVLRRQSFVDEVSSLCAGANLPRISPKVLAGMQIPLPPLPEQRRIAAILDKADALRAKRREAIAKLDQLLQSVFLDMFGDPVTNPIGWPVDDLCSYGEITTGNTPSRAVDKNYGSGVEWVKSDNLNHDGDYVTGAEERLSAAGEAQARVVPPGSILVTCIAGSFNCIGNLAIADRRVAFNQQINAVVLKEHPVEFVYCLLKASKKLIQAASTNSMKGMVSKSKFCAIKVPKPPIELQRDFARRFVTIAEAKKRMQQAALRHEAVFSGLQQQAFSERL